MQISIIVPVLNEERAIAATLESLTPLAIEEVIVVDGGRTEIPCFRSVNIGIGRAPALHSIIKTPQR